MLPLIAKDDGMATHARELFEELRKRFGGRARRCGQIGRRYRRQDEIGTPWAFTIDEQTLEDETVTVRERDSLAQERMPISGVASWLSAALGAALVSRRLRPDEFREQDDDGHPHGHADGRRTP